MSKDPTITTEVFHLARSLSLMNLAAEVEIEVGDVPRGIQVRLEMTPARAKQITCSVVGGILMVRDTFEGSAMVIRQGGQTVVNRGSISRSISVNGKTVNLDDAEAGEPLGKVVITIPKGVQVHVQDPVGTHRLGDTEGALSVQNSAVGDIQAGKVRSVVARLSGSGDLTVDELLGGVCDVSSTETGDFECEDGRAGELSLHTSGTGSLRFGGTAERADLVATGTGDIRVKHALTITREVNTGVGSVKVKRRG